MRCLIIILFSFAACTACRSDSPRATAIADSSSDLFPEIPPIADADPSVRHPVPVRVPTAMVVARCGDSLTVSFPTLEKTNLMVGHKMVTGIKREYTVYRDGAVPPGRMGFSRGLDFDSRTNVLNLGPDEMPKPGQEFTFEHRVTMFETDLPVQHMWRPRSGKHYRVLWVKTFRETVR